MFIVKLMIGHLLLALRIKLITASSGIPWLEQISRQELLLSMCNNLGLKESTHFNHSELDHVLVDHKHKLLYCYVPKVACTNWKRVFMVLTDQSNATNLAEIPATLAHAENSTLRLPELEEPEAERCLDQYVQFLMVRHPFERLVSAFRNKFENNLPSGKYFQARYGRYIVKKYRPGASQADAESGANVTFREFIQYLVNEGSSANEHWRPVSELCRPCSLNYTFIGRYEKLDEDSRVLLDMIGAPEVGFPQTRSGGTGGLLKEYFQQLSLAEIEKLYRLYEYDFKLFGYGLEDILGFDIG